MMTLHRLSFHTLHGDFQKPLNKLDMFENGRDSVTVPSGEEQ